MLLDIEYTYQLHNKTILQLLACRRYYNKEIEVDDEGEKFSEMVLS